MQDWSKVSKFKRVKSNNFTVRAVLCYLLSAPWRLDFYLLMSRACFFVLYSLTYTLFLCFYFFVFLIFQHLLFEKEYLCDSKLIFNLSLIYLLQSWLGVNLYFYSHIQCLPRLSVLFLEVEWNTP